MPEEQEATSEQAADPTVTVASEQPDATQAEPSLDDLLREFDADTQPAPEPKASETELKEMRDFMRSMQERELERDVSATVQNIRKSQEDSFVGIPDDWIEGRLEMEARRNPEFRTAFMQRNQKPGAWAQIQKAMGDKISKEITARADQQDVADREAVAASVRNRSETPPAVPGVDNADLSKLSDAEFDAYTKGLG